MTTLTTIKTALEGSGYEVALSPQEAMRPKTLLVILESFGVEVETSVSYFTRPTLSINFINNDVSKILTMIPALMTIIENSVVSSVRDFKFTEIETARTEGNEYLISIRFAYTEMLSLG